MPLMDGFPLAEQLLELKPDLEIVFVTAYKDHAVKASEMNALDYLLKPVQHSTNSIILPSTRLATTLERALQYVHKQELNRVSAEAAALYPPTLCCLQYLHYIDAAGKEQSFTWRTLKAPELFG